MATKPLEVINEKEFQKIYGNAIIIDEGHSQYETTEDHELKAITICNCVDHIALLAIWKSEKNGSTQNKCVLGWRLRKETIVEIEELFNQITEPNAICDFYIVGGNSLTTQGFNCLLDRIREAIKGFFNFNEYRFEKEEEDKKAHIVKEHLNLGSKTPYLTAKMDITGNLTFCRHMRAVNLK